MRGQKQNRTIIKLVLQTNTETTIGYLSFCAKYQAQTASPVWKTGALPLSYISQSTPYENRTRITRLKI